jgi:hypothetical protein
MAEAGPLLRAASALAVVLQAALLAAFLAGCATDARRGYTFGAAHDERLGTIAVPIFANDTFEHGVEAELTEALIKEIQRSTPWVVTTPDRAHTVLTGRIAAADMRSLSLARGVGMTQELAVRVVVDFDWVENETGRPLVSRRGFASVETFVPARPSMERRETGRRAAVQDLARSIVAELRGQW